MPKKIDQELKARAVRLVNEHAGEYASLTAAAAVVARQLGVGKESVRRWVLQAEVDEGQRPGASSEELAEIKTLKAKVRRLEEDNAILKAATVFFVFNAIVRGAWPEFVPFFVAPVLLVAGRPLCGSGQVSTSPPSKWLDRSLLRVVDVLN
jgi:transposase